MEKQNSKKTRTVDQIKKERQVPQQVREDLKKFNRMKKAIRQALEDGPLTIPALAERLDIDKSEVTYYLMSLRKYGFVIAGEQDDMDEYFFYQLKK